VIITEAGAGAIPSIVYDPRSSLNIVRLAAIVTAIAVATATAAARPPHDQAGDRFSHGGAQPTPPPRVGGVWIELAAPTSVNHGTELVVVGAADARFSRLRIDACAGTVIVLRLRVFYSDGTVTTVPVARVLDPQRKSTVIALGGEKAVDQIAITTDRHTGGTYALYGSSSELSIARADVQLLRFRALGAGSTRRSEELGSHRPMPVDAERGKCEHHRDRDDTQGDCEQHVHLDARESINRALHSHRAATSRLCEFIARSLRGGDIPSDDPCRGFVLRASCSRQRRQARARCRPAPSRPA